MQRTTNMPTHVPVYWLPGDGSDAECFRCGRAVTRDQHGNVRHVGERVAPFIPDPADSPAFARAVEVGESALSTLPDGTSDREAARALVIALYQDGMLRRTRKRAG